MPVDNGKNAHNKNTLEISSKYKTMWYVLTR